MQKSNARLDMCEGTEPFSVGATRWLLVIWLAALTLVTGCASHNKTKKDDSFFTSGSKDADQRASQRMAKAQELAGTGGAGGDSSSKKSSSGSESGGAIKAPQKEALYARLGAEVGISNIVNDALPRLLQDPRVNWDRKGVKQSGLFHHGPSVTWNAAPQNVALLKQHLIEFLALATGGPSHYTGRQIRTGHAGMQISNAEFDAAVGDIKASLDKLKVPDTEQKELLAVVESTRPEIVEQR